MVGWLGRFVIERKIWAAMVAVVVVASGLAAVVLFASNHPATPADNWTDPEHRTARAWVDLTSFSSGQEVRAEDRWGSVETLHGAPAGSTGWYRNVSLHQNAGSTESVFLDGYVWVMIRSDITKATLLRYTPTVLGPSWNISFECYAPQGADFFDPSWGAQQIGLTATLVDGNGTGLASVDLSYGTPGNSYVRMNDIAGSATQYFSDRLISPLTYKTPAEGGAPARYVVSFHRIDGGPCVVTVMHTSGVLVGQGEVTVPRNWSGPTQLVLSTSSDVQSRLGADPGVPWWSQIFSGSWVLDNFACRGATAPYPMAGPLYEYAGERSSAPAENSTVSGRQANATVTIDGREAAYDATTGRYEADLPLDVQWSKAVDYTVTLENVTLSDNMAMTMMSSTEHARLTEWWGGWDWVSVFGEDDCSGPSSALNTYQGYHHPLTAYIMYPEGSSDDILPTQSELALHTPHDWDTTGTKFWSEATAMAGQGMRAMKDQYAFASRWDDPANGGNGDTYISMANPGNRATYQLMYALYAAGVRIDGRSTDGTGAPGNHTQVGSWYSPGGYMDTGGGWYPYTPMDLLDAARSLSWDYSQSWDSAFGQIDEVARNHGVLRVYGHPQNSIAIPDVLHWIDNDKTNYSLENWKATDGEVASYIYGRWSTGVHFNANASTDGAWKFFVSSQDHQAAGYWKVPVTVALDLEGKKLKDVVVEDGGKTYRMSDGSLRDLHGARIMDLGFDVRDGVLYVSHTWGPSAQLTVEFDESIGNGVTLIDQPAEGIIMKEP
jgi:hypothetical protein